jgi:N-formylglutamate amidohydrolase
MHTELMARERTSVEAELTPPFALSEPREQLTPLVFCSPHSGRVYPRALIETSRLDALTLRKSEDCFVDELFGGVVKLGAPLIAARFPRAFVDANREPYELDPELFIERVPAFANAQSVRVAGGLGTIPRIVADGEEIYAERLPLALGLARIEQLYRPFHARLASLIDQTRERFGVAVLIDCHSMPSISSGQPSNARPHFVIGDRFGASCEARLTRLVRDTLQGLGFDAQLNRPYAGGFITEHYGRPSSGVHALQIEINRALYLNEATLEKTSGFEPLAAVLQHLTQRLMADLPSARAQRHAAE